MNSSKNFFVIIRILVIICAVGGIAFFIPPLHPSLDIFGLHNANIFLIFTIIIAFLIEQALERKNSIDAEADLELNKLRRLFHLTEFLTNDPAFKTWCPRVSNNLKKYLKAFAHTDFRSYKTTDDEFHNLTHSLYAAPQKMSAGSRELYAEILRTSSTLSETRQHLRSLTQAGLSSYEWSIMLIITTGVFGLSTILSDGTLNSRIISAIVAISVALVLDFLWSTDRPGKKWALDISERYVKTLKKLY